MGTGAQALVRSRRGEYVRAELVNASYKGACLECPAGLNPRNVAVALKVEDRFLTLHGRVTWSRRERGGARRVGLRLEPLACDRESWVMWLLNQQLNPRRAR